VDLLERASFLNALAEYAAEARGGDGRLVLVSGESGIGKTALLEAFQRRGKGARWLWGACDGLLTPRPLGPLFDIGPQAGGELAELCRRDAPRDQLFAALAAELSSPALTVVAMEDLHWADEATVDMLSFLGRRLARMAALVLVTYRDDEVDEDHPLRVALGDLATQRATRRIKLPPLSAAAVAALAGQRDLDAAELHRITGGNPFFVTEVLAAGWPSVPATVRDAVGARLARATPAARRAVEAAAVIGTRVDGALLASVLAGAEGGAADDGVASGVLAADGTGFRFRHELARIAVDAGIAPQRKRELHARVLAALQDHADADPAVLAHHAEGAGDAEAVLRHAPAAARRSSALGAHREAAAQYERALRFAAGEEAATRASLYAALAGEDSFLDRFEDAAAAALAALELYRQVGDLLGQGDMQRRLSRIMWRLCRGAEVASYANAAVATLEPLGVTEELARAYEAQAFFTQSMPAAQRAQQLAEELQLPAVLSDALNTEACIRYHDGGQWQPMLDRALRIALDAGAAEQAGRAYSNLHSILFEQRRLAETERYFREGIAYCEPHDMPIFVSCLQGWRANVLEQLGDWDEAAALCTAVLEISASPVNRLTSLVALGLIRARRGDAAAWQCLDEAIENARGTGESSWIAMAVLARAEARWLEGDLAAARDELAAVYEAANQEGGFVRGALTAWLRRTGSALEPPPGQAAEPHTLALAGRFREAAEAWERLGCRYEAALALFDAQDEESLREALRRFDDLGASAAASIARRALRGLGARQVPAGARAAARAHPLGLTRREQQVLALLAEGLPDREISRRLVISERTVHHHVSAVLSKTGARSRAAVAREAAQMGTGAPV
jgi:DNA-binding CsgD family transcriptional regulator